ncbi:hypothetical protein SLS53_001531 [Cytospora paraplurivora]|uniref:Uncharacterized protein n=1 Tax=Cytospora paraplurivora TaxID=2898453 RepID=A0AAN9UQX5_9PEZI
MAGYVNATWEVPPLEVLNISDCDAIAPWLAYLLNAEAEEGTKYKGVSGKLELQTDFPMRVAVKFLRSLVPDNWTTPTDGDLLLWHLGLWNANGYFAADNGTTFLDIFLYGIGGCGSTMIISFYTVAIFVTIFYLALVPGVFEAYGRETRSSKLVSLYRKCASGFEESIAGFLDAMLLFTISMLIAAITRYASVLENPHESHSLFGLQDCVFLTAFAILSTLVLQSLSYDLRRQRIRMVLWGLLMALTITLEVFYRREYIDYFTGNGATWSHHAIQEDAQIIWHTFCQSDRLRRTLQSLLTAGHCVMGINAAAGIYLMLETFFGDRWIPKLQCHARLWNIWETCKICLRLGNGLLCVIIMWAFLGLFTAYRKDGVRKGVEGKLSRRYTVVERTDTRVQDSVVYEKTPAVETTPMDDVVR